MEDFSCQRQMGFKRTMDEEEYFSPPKRRRRPLPGEMLDFFPVLGIEIWDVGENDDMDQYCIIEINKKTLPDESEELVSRVISESTLPKISKSKLKIGEALGGGVFGEVFRGTLTLDDGEVADVAIKQIRPLIQQVFTYEALLLQDMNGVGGVPRLYGMVGGRKPAIVMEYVGGDTLIHMLEGRHLPDTFGVFIALCDAVQELHDAGFSHGDLHHHNAICQKDFDGKIRCRLIDVGLAQRVFDGIHVDDDDFSVASFALRCCGLYEESEEVRRFESVVSATQKGPHFIGTLQKAASAMLKSLE